jgi:hypothetical protein
MPKALPAKPSLAWLRKAAKHRLVTLRAHDPEAKLTTAQRDIAGEYGFTSWRALKAHIDAHDHVPTRPDRKAVFDAARCGDVDAVRRAFAAGFEPNAADDDGRTVHQIAKANGFEAIELIVRDAQGETRPREVVEPVTGILDAAWRGELDLLGQRLDAQWAGPTSSAARILRNSSANAAVTNEGDPRMMRARPERRLSRGATS